MSNELVILSDENKAIPGKQIILQNSLLDSFNNLDKIKIILIPVYLFQLLLPCSPAKSNPQID